MRVETPIIAYTILHPPKRGRSTKKTRLQADDKRGAHFISRFTKPIRNTPEEIPPYEWCIQTDPDSGEISVTHKRAHSLDVFRKLIEEGVTVCTDIADEMNVSNATVSKMAKKAMDAGWLKKDGRGYKLSGSAE